MRVPLLKISLPIVRQSQLHNCNTSVVLITYSKTKNMHKKCKKKPFYQIKFLEIRKDFKRWKIPQKIYMWDMHLQKLMNCVCTEFVWSDSGLGHRTIMKHKLRKITFVMNSIFKLTKQDKIKITGDISNLLQNHCQT